MTYDRLQIRRGTATQWSNTPVTPLQGEPTFDVTNNRLKIGDGTTAYSALAPIGSNASDLVSGTLNDARLSANVPKYDIQGPTYEANRPFGFIRDSFNLTANATPYQNTVEQWGYNLRRSNTNEPTGGFAIESKYALNNQGPYVMEFHIQGQYTNGNVWRLFSAAHPIAEADLATSQCSFITQTFSLQKADGSERIKYDWVSNVVNYTSAQAHQLGTNNHAYFRQLNAAGNGYLTYPYFNNLDAYYVPALNVKFDGALSVGGDITCQSLKLTFEKSIDFAHPTLGQNNQFTLRQTATNVLSLRANTNAGFDINATSGRATCRGVMSVNDPTHTIADNGVGTQLSVLGSLGLYTATSNNGAAIYLGDSNFRASAYWDAAPGFAAIDTGQGIASGLGFYTYTGPNSRTLAMAITHEQYVQCKSRFACNNATPQAKQTVNAAATDAATTQALVNQLRTALINVGICV